MSRRIHRWFPVPSASCLRGFVFIPSETRLSDQSIAALAGDGDRFHPEQLSGGRKKAGARRTRRQGRSAGWRRSESLPKIVPGNSAAPTTVKEACRRPRWLALSSPAAQGNTDEALTLSFSRPHA